MVLKIVAHNFPTEKQNYFYCKIVCKMYFAIVYGGNDLRHFLEYLQISSILVLLYAMLLTFF